MGEIVLVVIVFMLFVGGAALGMLVRPRLSERHLTRETIELMQISISLLVTFAAIVLGLLTAAVKQHYDTAARDRQEYALQLTALDQCLRDYGPGSAAARADIRSYTAAVIASTWPSEPPPQDVQYPSTSGMPRVGASSVLANLMDRVGIEITRLASNDPAQARVAELCLDRYKDVARARLDVIEAVQSGELEPFSRVLIFWLMILFACFGLVAPRNGLSMVTIFLCAISLASVMFVIADLSRPYTGYFSISSSAMRSALRSML